MSTRSPKLASCPKSVKLLSRSEIKVDTRGSLANGKTHAKRRTIDRQIRTSARGFIVLRIKNRPINQLSQAVRTVLNRNERYPATPAGNLRRECKMSSKRSPTIIMFAKGPGELRLLQTRT